MKRVKFISIVVCLLAVLFVVNSANAQTVTGVRTLPLFVSVGGYIDVSIDIDVDEANAPNAFIVTEYIPFTWTPIDASPMYQVYTDGTLKWLFFSLGNPVEDSIISYSLSVPTGASGTYTFTGDLKYFDPANGGAATTTSTSGNFQTTVVAEPISSALFIVGGATLGFRRFRKKFKI